MSAARGATGRSGRGRPAGMCNGSVGHRAEELRRASLALDAIVRGTWTVDDLKKGLPALRVASTVEEAARVAATAAPFLLILETLPSAVGDLIAFGWLPAAGRADDPTAGAVVRLAERALAVGLKPW